MNYIDKTRATADDTGTQTVHTTTDIPPKTMIQPLSMQNRHENTHAQAPLDAPARPVLPDAQTITEVEHYTDHLFRFRTTRPAGLRFRSGEFVMIGLPGDLDPKTGKQKPILRAYSIASPHWDDSLEFYSIKVENGPLTSKLQHLKPGDQIILRPKPVGTLVHDALLPGKRLWFFATGTGIAPFASLLRDGQTYEKYDQIILTHTCRTVPELTYGDGLIKTIHQDDMFKDLIGENNLKKLVYYPTTTQDKSGKMGRITDLLENGTVFKDLNITDGLSPQTDRAMICGSLSLNTDLKKILQNYGLEEGGNSNPKHFVVEKAFVG